MVEDRGQRVLSYSPQTGTVDRLRVDSILHRETAVEVVEWYKQFGISRATEPVRLGANPELGILARVCVPIAYRGMALGFLWLIDADGSMDDSEVASAVAASHSMGLAIYRQSLIDKQATYDLRNLLSANPRLQATAAQRLVDSEVFVDVGLVVAMVVAPCGLQHPQIAEATSTVEDALRIAQREAPPRHALSLVRQDHGVLLLAMGSLNARRLAEKLAGAATNSRHSSSQGLNFVVGVGEPVSLRNASASYAQARQAARLAGSLPELGPVADWATLGVFRALLQLPTDELRSTILDPRLVKLLESQASEVLTPTLEVYLDLAGDVQHTAMKVGVHRATLYYRLNRIEELTGASLSNGHDRLAFHVGLKIARFADLYRW